MKTTISSQMNFGSKHEGDALARVNAMVQRLGLAPASTSAPTADTAQKTMQTRANFYARKNGGGYRIARKACKCQQFGCYDPISPGERYFDTQEVTEWPKTKKICAHCAETLV